MDQALLCPQTTLQTCCSTGGHLPVVLGKDGQPVFGPDGAPVLVDAQGMSSPLGRQDS